jgi:beta-mannosidase
VYSCTFPTPCAPAGAQILLVCHGLDTATAVTLNGQAVGSTDNQFVRYTFDITAALERNNNVENRLDIRFRNMVDYARECHDAYPYDVPDDFFMAVACGEQHRNYVRKEQCSFSWDWGIMRVSRS